VRVRAGAATDIGLVRERNEDSLLVEEPLFVVADGMGGHRGGDVASRLALETMGALFRRGEGVLAEQVQEANRAVFERSSTDRSVSGMGTTLTAVLIDGDRAHLAHVGDSRAYLLRDGDLRMLTEDHTLVHRMVQQGEITEAEAERHPQRSVVTRALGIETSVPVDEVVVDLREGDRLLICSDGLTAMLDDETVRALLGADPDPERTAHTLVRAANQAGGVDNTTVIVIDVGPETGDPLERPRDTVVDAGAPSGADVTRAPGPGERGRPRRRRFGWRRAGAIAGAIVALGLLALVGLRTYLDAQWYVGVADGRVAIYRGIPTEVAGFELHHVVVETAIPAADAERLAVYRTQLPDGITAQDRTDAEQIVEQIRRDVAAAGAGPVEPGGSA
jgi:serine/threonine protein phosphatase PrpC